MEGVLGLPTIMVELAGLGYGREIEGVWIERGVRGVRNVMIALGLHDPATRWIML